MTGKPSDQPPRASRIEVAAVMNGWIIRTGCTDYRTDGGPISESYAAETPTRLLDIVSGLALGQPIPAPDGKDPSDV